MASNDIYVNVAPQAVNVEFRTVQTRDIDFGYDPFNGDGVTTEFTLSAQCKSNGIVVFVNGVVAKQGTEGSPSSGTYYLNSMRTKIVFFTAPGGGTYKDEILAFFAKA